MHKLYAQRKPLQVRGEKGWRGFSNRRSLEDPAPIYFSNPNTATPVCVPTYTFPFAIIGVMYLFPGPN